MTLECIDMSEKSTPRMAAGPVCVFVYETPPRFREPSTFGAAFEIKTKKPFDDVEIVEGLD